MNLTKHQQEILDAEGHLLVTGGPGTGKTTVSILKAAELTKTILPSQRILFLSFARATVSRVIEAIDQEKEITREAKAAIEVSTYHAFFWTIIKTHGYLIGLPNKVEIFTQQNQAVALSTLRGNYSTRDSNEDEKEKIHKVNQLLENNYLRELACAEGKICFDLYAQFTYEIIGRSAKIRKLLADKYPFIILDEFQDTNAMQWQVVKELGKECTLLALADPEQRIFDFIGADPERLNHFTNTFNPKYVDLAEDNHRSKGTDIFKFANSVLTGNFEQEEYFGVEIKKFPAFKNLPYSELITTIYQSRKRLQEQNITDWSLAILVPTKKMVRDIAEVLQNPHLYYKTSRHPIPHTASIELDGAILGAEIIAFLMQKTQADDDFINFAILVANFFRGKSGEKVVKSNLIEAENIEMNCIELDKALKNNIPYPASRKISKMYKVYNQIKSLCLCGSPHEDWLLICKHLKDGACKRLKQVEAEVKNLRIIVKSEQLQNDLLQCWMIHGYYNDAHKKIKNYFAQLHFATASKVESGIIVMNMHKAKGKQFDEVIIFEGWPRVVKGGKIIGNPDRIVRGNVVENVDAQTKQNLRVSITRSRRRTTILTPKNDPCILLK